MRQTTFIEDVIYGSERVRLALNFSRSLATQERLTGARLVSSQYVRRTRTDPVAESPEAPDTGSSGTTYLHVESGTILASGKTLSFVVAGAGDTGLWRLRFEMRTSRGLSFRHDVYLWTMEAGGFTPSPHALRVRDYELFSWSPTSQAGSYPPSTRLLRGGGQDPTLAAEPTANYTDAYNLTAGTRVNGLGPEGLSFLNTSVQGDLGALVVGLDTVEVRSVVVSWEAGTVSAGGRPYRLSLQYRVGSSGPWSLLESYQDAATGHSQDRVSLLPPGVEDQPYVQLRWKYHASGSGSGARPQLRVGRLFITADR